MPELARALSLLAPAEETPDERTPVAACAGADRQARGQAGFQPCRRARGGRGSAAADRRQPVRNPRLRLHDDPRARRSGRRGRRLGRRAYPRRTAQGPARHDADARLRRAHAALAAAGQDVVLHPVPRRGGDRLRPSQGAGARRHVLSDLPPAGAPDRARLAAGRYDVRDLLQRKGPAERPPAAGALFVEGGRVLHRLRQSRHAISAGGRLGDGLGDHGRHQDRLGLDRRRRDGGNRFPFGAGVRLRLPPAGHSQHRQQPVGDLVLSGHRRRRERQIRRPRAWLRHRVAPRRRQRLSRGLRRVEMGGRAGAGQSRPDADRMGDLPRRRPFDLGRPIEIPAEG